MTSKITPKTKQSNKQRHPAPRPTWATEFAFWILLLTPIFIVPNIYSLMTLGKVSLLRIGGAIGLIFITGWWIWRRPRSTPFALNTTPSAMLIPLGLLTLCTGLAALFGFDPWVALVGSFERNFGFIGYALCFALFLSLILQTSASADQLRRSIAWMYWIGALFAIEAILQVCQINIVTFIPPLSSSDALPYSFAGNSGSLSCIMALVFPFGIYLWKSAPSRTERIAILLGALFMLTAFYLARTRTVWVALAITGGIACAILLLRYMRTREHPIPWKRILLMSGVLLIVLSSTIVFINSVRNTGNDWLTKGFESSKTARTYLIRDSFQVIRRYPVFGIGSENFRPAFMPFLSKELGELPTKMYDNPHDNYLSVLAQFGLAGLIAFLWILWRWGKWSLFLFSASENPKRPHSSWLGFSFLLSLIVYLLWQISWFDTVVTLPWIFLLLALLDLSIHPWECRSTFVFEMHLQSMIPRYGRWISLAIIPLAILSIVVTYRFLAADILFRDIYGPLKLSEQGDTRYLNETIAQLEEARRWNPWESRFSVELSRLHLRRYAASRIPSDVDMALDDANRALNHAWEHDKIHQLRMHAYALKGQKLSAYEAGEQALHYAPWDNRLRIRLTQIDMELGRLDKAKTYLQQTLERDPRHFVALGMLCKLYTAQREKNLAEYYARKILEYYPDKGAQVESELMPGIRQL